MKNILLALLLLACPPAFAALRGTAQQANTSSAASDVVTVTPIGIVNGDIVLIYAAAGNGVTGFTFPSGFAAVPGLTASFCNSGGNDIQLVEYKVASGEPSTYTVSATGSDFISVQVRVYSGRNTSSPFTAVSTTVYTVASGASPSTISLTGLTAATADDVAAFSCYANNGTVSTDTYTFGAPSGWANALTAWGSVSFGMVEGSADHVNITGGATGTLSASLTYSPNRPDGYAGYVLSLAAASGTAAPTNGAFSTIAQNRSVKASNGHPVISNGHPLIGKNLRESWMDRRRVA